MSQTGTANPSRAAVGHFSNATALGARQFRAPRDRKGRRGLGTKPRWSRWLAPSVAGLVFALAPQTQAQSIWNAGTGSWFTPADWTPNGTPTSTTDTQINNAGTAQVSSAGAVARTVFLGNAMGDTGHLEVSGVGTLTTNPSAGFFLVVGEGGTGTLSISSGGSVSAPVIYFGDLTGSSGTGTVTGTGSLLSGTFDMEVGRSGQGTLNILNGGSVSTGVFAVGNGTGSGTVLVDGTTGVTTSLTATGVNIGGNSLGSTGDVTLTGAKAKFSGGGVDVGSAGSGTLTLSVGAVGKGTSLLIGDAGTGAVTLTDTGTTFSVSTSSATGTVTVGGSAAGNLNVEAGATLTSDLGVIGKNPGGIGVVTITGAGSAWSLNQSFTLIVGQASAAGGSGTLDILNGGKFSAANLDAFTGTTIKVDGTGSQLLLPNDFPANKSLDLGSTGINKLDVTAGGTLATGSTLFTTTATSSLAINLAGAGSSWTQTPFVGTLTTQFGGAGTATFAVSDHAVLSYAQDGIFNVDATGAGTASLKVSSSGSFSIGTTSGTLRIGQNANGSLTIDSGGIVNTAHSYIGENAGAVGTASISGAGSTWNAGDLEVGSLGGQGSVDISGGAKVTGAGQIGPSIVVGGSGSVTLSGAGTSWVAQPISNGPNDQIAVYTGSSLTVQSGALLKAGALSVGGTGAITIQGAGTKIQSFFNISSSGTSTLKILDGAVVNGSLTLLAGGAGVGTVATVDGATTQWLMTSGAEIGVNAKATLNIQNGAKLSSTQFYLGYDTNGTGLVNVMGTGSSWSASGYLRVADWTNTAGTLTISQGGTVTSVSGANASIISGIGSTNTANGSIVVTDANSSWTNTGDIYIGKGGTVGIGALTVVNSGAVTITGATSINATSALNIGNGGAAGSFSSASVANSGLIHFNLTDSATYSSPTSGAGTVVKDGAGAVTITGTHTYTGATTINGGLFQVDGSLGNTAVTVASGGTLGGAGSIGGAVTIQNGGSIAPGDSPGTITVGSLVLNSTSILNYQLGAPGTVGGGVNDLIEVTGNLTLDGTLNITGLAGFAPGVYRLIDYGGILTNNILSVGSAPSGNGYGVVTSSAGQVNLIVASSALSFWDGTQTVANGVVDGGVGSWDNNQTNWTDVSGNVNAKWSGQTAVFSGAAGTVVLGDNISFQGMQFMTTGYVVNQDAGHLFTLTPTGGAAITVDPSVTATINAPLTGGGSIAKNGAGTLVLTGTSTYSSGTTINAGTLQLGVTGTGAKIVGSVTNHAVLQVINADTSGITTLTNTGGATTFFHNSTSASAINITNGNAASAAAGGQTLFQDSSTASSSVIVNDGGASSVDDGGRTKFQGSATAASATITNNGGTANGAPGGSTFVDSGASAGSAAITDNPGAVSGAQGGLVNINGSVGSATIINVGAAVAGAQAGNAFINGNTAGATHITNQGATAAGADGGFTAYVSGRLDGAVIMNQAGAVSGANGGKTTIFDPTSADGGTITNAGAAVGGAKGGTTLISSNTFPAKFTITNNGGSANGAGGGSTTFLNDTSSANSSLTNTGGTASGAEGGLLQFQDTSSAGSSTITSQAGTVAGAQGGSVQFQSGSTAGSSTITNFGGAGPGTLGATTTFSGTASAGSATLLTNGGSTGGGGAQTFFTGASDGGTATAITGGNGQFDISGLTSTGMGIGSIAGAGTYFLGSKQLTEGDAGSTTVNGLITDGGASGGVGGSLVKTGSGTLTLAGTSSYTGATTLNQGVLQAGSNTGLAPASAFKISSGTTLDINGFNNSIGSLADGAGGGGFVTNTAAGTATLTVGNNNANTAFSGVLQNGVGQLALIKTGSGTLNLTGANTYNGTTSVNAGILRVNGSLGATALTVNNGGVLGGTGTIGGPVTIANGGILAPGNSPGTLTMGSLTLSSGSKLSYELAVAGVTGGGVNDLTAVMGNLTLSGATIDVTGLPGFGPGIYPIITYTGTLIGSALSVGAAPLGFVLTVDTSVGHVVDLIAVGGGALPIAYWNGAHLAPNGVVNGGSGTWDNATTNWTDSTGNVLGKWGSAAGVFGGAPGVVTLGDNVSFSSLEFVTGGYAVNGAGFSLTATGVAPVITDTGVTMINAPITGAGGITKNGPGTLYLNAQNTYLGPTLLTNGGLYINGSVAGDVQVLAGLLGGSGRIGGNLSNNGTVSPGNSPGTLQVGGNFTQSASGVLRSEVGGRQAGEFDRLDIGGHASVNGTLQIVQVNGFNLKRGDFLVLLSAGQGIDGAFSNVMDPFTSNTLLQPAVIYGPNSVALTLVQGSFAGLAGLTPNQRSVARELDRVAFDPRTDKLIGYLDDRELNNLPRDYDRIAPEELSVLSQISISLATLQSVNIQRRMDDIHAGANGFSAAGFAMSGGSETRSGGYEVAGFAGPDGKDGKAVFVPTPDNRWGVFITGIGQFVDIGNHDFNASGYNIETGGFTLGVDYKITPHIAVGFSVGYAGTTADLANGGRVFVDGGKGGFYGTYFDGGFYADAAVSGGGNAYETRRSALQGDARGGADGGELNALLATGYDWKKGAFTFGPTATFNYTYVGIGGFEERGSLAPLDVAGQHGESLRTALGMKASCDWKLGGVLIRPEIRAAWQHEFGDRSFAIDSRLASGAGDLFSVQGPRMGRDSLLLGAGFAVQWTERVSTYVYYDGELGRTNYSSQNISGGVSVTF